jgi:hypothetical protein
VHQPVVRSARPLVARGRYGGYLARRALPVLRRFSAECPTTPGTQVPYATSSINFPSPANASTLTSPHHIERPRATGFNPQPVSISRNNLQLFSRDPRDLYPSPFFFHDTARQDFGSKLIPPPPVLQKRGWKFMKTKKVWGKGAKKRGCKVMKTKGAVLHRVAANCKETDFFVARHRLGRWLRDLRLLKVDGSAQRSSAILPHSQITYTYYCWTSRRGAPPKN